MIQIALIMNKKKTITRNLRGAEKYYRYKQNTVFFFLSFFRGNRALLHMYPKYCVSDQIF